MSETKPNDTKPSEVKPKKMVRRSVAMALGIICIILVAALGVVAYMGYSPTTTNSVTSLQSQINDLNSTYNSYVSAHSHTNDDFNSLSSQNTNLQNQNNQLQAWLDGNETLLNQTETWLDDNITYYNSQISSLNSQIANLQNQKNQLQTWLSGNITAATNYANDHSHTNEEYQNLLNQIANLQNQISSLNAQITSLQSQIANLQAPKLIEVNLKSDDNRPFLGTFYLHVYGEVCNVGSNIAYNCKLHVTAYQSGGVVAINTDIVLGIIGGESWVSVDASPTYSGGSLTSWTITTQWTVTP